MLQNSAGDLNMPQGKSHSTLNHLQRPKPVLCLCLCLPSMETHLSSGLFTRSQCKTPGNRSRYVADRGSMSIDDREKLVLNSFFAFTHPSPFILNFCRFHLLRSLKFIQRLLSARSYCRRSQDNFSSQFLQCPPNGTPSLQSCLLPVHALPRSLRHLCYVVSQLQTPPEIRSKP